MIVSCILWYIYVNQILYYNYVLNFSTKMANCFQMSQNLASSRTEQFHGLYCNIYFPFCKHIIINLM